MTEHIDTDDTLKAYFDLAHWLGGRVQGWERSLKIARGELDAKRWLFGFDKQGLDPAMLVSRLGRLGLPPAVSSAVFAEWDRSNFVYLALEARQPAVIKLYLEFPVLLGTRTGAHFEWGDAALWCRGYKWRVGEVALRITDYRMVPGATLASLAHHHPALVAERMFAAVLDRLALVLSETGLNRPGALDMLLLSTPPASIGIDLRLYDLGLRIGDIRSAVLNTAADFLDVTAVRALARALETHAESALGHVSMGWRSPAGAYLNLYWEEAEPDEHAGFMPNEANA